MTNNLSPEVRECNNLMSLAESSDVDSVALALTLCTSIGVPVFDVAHKAVSCAKDYYRWHTVGSLILAHFWSIEYPDIPESNRACEYGLEIVLQPVSIHFFVGESRQLSHLEICKDGYKFELDRETSLQILFFRMVAYYDSQASQ